MMAHEKNIFVDTIRFGMNFSNLQQLFLWVWRAVVQSALSFFPIEWLCCMILERQRLMLSADLS